MPTGHPTCVDDKDKPILCSDDKDCCPGFVCGHDPDLKSAKSILYLRRLTREARGALGVGYNVPRARWAVANCRTTFC